MMYFFIKFQRLQARMQNSCISLRGHQAAPQHWTWTALRCQDKRAACMGRPTLPCGMCLPGPGTRELSAGLTLERGLSQGCLLGRETPAEKVRSKLPWPQRPLGRPGLAPQHLLRHSWGLRAICVANPDPEREFNAARLPVFFQHERTRETQNPGLNASVLLSPALKGKQCISAGVTPEEAGFCPLPPILALLTEAVGRYACLSGILGNPRGK